MEYRRALTISSDDVLIHNKLGMIYMKQGKRPEAIEHFRTAIQKGSNDPKVFYNLGVILYQQGKKGDGEKMFRKATQLNLNYTKAYLNLSKIYMDQREFNLAIQALQEVIQISPGDYLSHFDLALLLDRKGLNKEAD